jgi:ABC-type transporter Mla subunit MlaD
MRLTVIKHEIVVGWFVVGALIVAAVGVVVQTRTRGMLDAVDFSLEVPHARGLQRGAPVEMRGITVGSVTQVQLTKQDRVRVELEVSGTYAPHVHPDALAVLVEPPFIGTTKVELLPGNARGSAAPGSQLTARMDQGMMEQMNRRVDGVIADVDSFVAVASATLEETRKVLARLDRGEGVAGRLVADEQLGADVAASVSNLRKATDRFDQEGLDRTMAVIREAESLVTSLNAEDGELQTLLRQLTRTTDEVRAALAEAEVGKTSAELRAAALALAETAERMEVSEETRSALAAFQKASEAMQDLAEELERQPNAVIFGRAEAASPGTRR